jgi:hypothetical protein
MQVEATSKPKEVKMPQEEAATLALPDLSSRDLWLQKRPHMLSPRLREVSIYNRDNRKGQVVRRDILRKMPELEHRLVDPRDCPSSRCRQQES